METLTLWRVYGILRKVKILRRDPQNLRFHTVFSFVDLAFLHAFLLGKKKGFITAPLFLFYWSYRHFFVIFQMCLSSREKKQVVH